MICTKHLPDLEQLLLGRFYEITDKGMYMNIIIEESTPEPKNRGGVGMD
jgi:hypothetical protein